MDLAGRPEPPLVADERATPAGRLDFHRGHADLLREAIDGTTGA
jgi:hypothetical protein